MFRQSRTVFGAVALSITAFAFAAVAEKDGHDGHGDGHGDGRIEGRNGQATVEAVAKPALGKFSGSVDGVSVKEADGKVIFTVDLPRGLKMGMRDSHTREAFEVEKDKYKTVQLTVDRGDIKVPDDKPVNGSVKGSLKLHGETKPVTVKYKAKRDGSKVDLAGSTFTFNYTDFGVAKICKLAICVEPPVTVTITDMKVQAKK